MRTPLTALLLLVSVLSVIGWPQCALASDPWLDRVKYFEVGTSAGFGQERLPYIVLGPPRGGGRLQGSTDTLSLGEGGVIVVVFNDNLVFDGPGDDLVVYENAFHVGSETGQIFTEFGYVEVSDDNKSWHRFAVDVQTGEGLAGRTPVLATPGNGIDPLSIEAGGDRFDLADVGLEFVRFVRIIDVNGAIQDRGDFVPPAGKGGFDLDAMGAIHSTPPARVYGTVADAGMPVLRARVKLIPLDGGVRRRRWTNAAGAFRFGRVLPTGDYELRTRKSGVGARSDLVHVDRDRLDARIDVTLD
jgi:hypothetical protein